MTKVPLHQVAGVLAKRSLDSAGGEKKFAQEIAAFLLDTSRTGQLNSLARDMVLARVSGGIVEVTAVSAHEFTDEIRTEIRGQISKIYPAAKDIIINEHRAPNVIGGVRLEFPDRQLDLSIRNKLNRFKALTA